MRQLERLTIDGGFNKPQAIDSRRPLSGLTRLRYLSIRNTRIAREGFDPILGLPNLTAFYSAWFYPPSEFEKLKSMPNLVEGNVAGINEHRKYTSKT
jgi:hypothetical protein